MQYVLNIYNKYLVQMKPVNGVQIIKRHSEISSGTPALRSFPYSSSPAHILLAQESSTGPRPCLLYTSDAADEVY